MPLTLKQILTPVFLRIFPIQNLEPSAVLPLRDVGCGFLLGNDALQVQFANTFKQRHPTAVNVIRYISAEKWQVTVPATAEVPACGLAIAQFANPSRHRSTDRMRKSMADSREKR